jgi:hypothetical protein
MCCNAKMQTHVNGMSPLCCLVSRRPIARMGHPSQDRLPAVLVKCITHKNTICPLLKHCATAAALPTTLTPDNALTIVCLVPLSTLECPLCTSERTHCRRRLTMRAAAALPFLFSVSSFVALFRMCAKPRHDYSTVPCCARVALHGLFGSIPPAAGGQSRRLRRHVFAVDKVRVCSAPKPITSAPRRPRPMSSLIVSAPLRSVMVAIPSEGCCAYVAHWAALCAVCCT